MAYDEQETRHSKVIVDTPDARREVTTTRREYIAEPNRTSTATVAVLVILAVAIAGLLGLLFWNMQMNSNNANLAAQQPTPQIVQQPAAQPPVIIQQPAPAQQAPIIVNPPAGTEALTGDDQTVQMAVDKKLQNDATFSRLEITATVASGKVLLVGTVKSDALKNDVERAVKSIKGVKSVDNQIAVVNT